MSEGIVADASFVDDVYRPLSMALAKVGRNSEAVAVASAGVFFNSANSVALRELRTYAEQVDAKDLTSLLNDESEQGD